MVGTRSRAIRRRLSDHDIRCSASDRRWFPARPAQHVHGRRNEGKGQIHRHSRARMAETAKDGARHATQDAPERIDHRRRCTRHDHRTCCRGSRGSASLPCPRCENASKCATPDRAGARPLGIDLIPYVDACGRPPDRSDELISLHRRQISKLRICGRSRMSISRQFMASDVVNSTSVFELMAANRQSKSYWLSFCLRLLCETYSCRKASQ
jgi:hypothetical protein